MANHPNRNWRARMRASLGQWLDALDWPGELVMATREQVREMLSSAYRAGYEAGRASTKTPSRTNK